MKVDSCIEEVEKCMQTYKTQLQEQKKELQEDEQKVLNILSAFYKKDPPKPSINCQDPMTISLPNSSSISSLFKDDSAESFIFKLGQGDKRQHLAAERRAEYNSYLEKKDKELHSRRKVLEESRSVTPRSILESVDYEKILAKRKEEESKFRNLNYAEPSIDKKISKPEISVKENVDLSLENKIKPIAEPPIPKPVPTPEHRTGGGGEPVRDSSGNLITNRGFKKSSFQDSDYFPFLQDTSKQKRDFYREELRKQIEEKRRMKELEEEKARLLEEQIAQRIEQQRRQMQMDYEKELQKNNLLKEQRQQERLKQLEEFQKRDAAMKNKRTRQMQERRDSTDLNVVPEPPKRSVSPPVPSVRSKVILERVVSPDVTTKTQALSNVKPENIFSSLAEIRRTIMQEQQNAKKDLKDSYEVMNRRTVVDDSDDLHF